MKHELRTILITGVVASFATTLVIAGIIGTFLVKRGGMDLVRHPFAIQKETSSATPVTSFDESAVVAAVKRANPAVVAITISKNVPIYEEYYERVPFPFPDFFGGGSDFRVPQYRQRGTQKQDVGGGSGFLVSEDGYIVTNRHVVDDESAEYTVFTNDGTQYPATVVARDPSLDLAIIKIKGDGFPHLTFADSDHLEVGQTAIAIGNALAEFRNTVSVGVISGLSRSIVASDRTGSTEALDQLIQTDAAINGGNSGGPLLDLSGEVIGVNVAVASGAENIGFALSGNSVRSVVESVREHGKIVRPYLGVRYLPITEELRKKNGISVDHGVLVLRGQDPTDLAVVPGSPADKAGIVENDIITAMDGVELTKDTSLAALIRAKRVGDTVNLNVLSKGASRTVSVTLEAVPE